MQACTNRPRVHLTLAVKTWEFNGGQITAHHWHHKAYLPCPFLGRTSSSKFSFSAHNGIYCAIRVILDAVDCFTLEQTTLSGLLIELEFHTVPDAQQVLQCR